MAGLRHALSGHTIEREDCETHFHSHGLLAQSSGSLHSEIGGSRIKNYTHGQALLPENSATHARKLAPFREGAREGMRILKRIYSKVKDAPAQKDVDATALAAWKADALAVVQAVQHKLVEAGNSSADCSVALLYAHARIDSLVQRATSLCRLVDEPMLSILPLIMGLCDPSKDFSTDEQRCKAAAMACEDFIHHGRTHVH